MSNFSEFISRKNRSFSNYSVILDFISGQVLQNTPSLLVKCDSQLTADVIPYNNRNDGGPAAGTDCT
jgi:hypothetical protein